MSRIRKVAVSTGISWVEVPEADLRVLCGCPADAVKHLLRRGLILPIELGGIACESGPNAILLSDLAMQNGMPCNRGEFPVLQMLYKQGMLIPDHPGNTGARPLILGSRRQVDAQLAYLFRGNYGLASREELIGAGATAAQADEIMRMKLAFAYGRILDSTELVEPRYVGADAVEIRAGVRLRRLRSNVFEFACGEERVEVDLNLPPGEGYACPYTLDNHLLEPEYFAVVHTGDGDGWDMNRPPMGSIVLFQGSVYLIDAGPNIHHALGALGIGLNEIDGVFHTHCHDDHMAGLTTLIRGDRRVPYYAVPIVRASVVRKLSSVMQITERDFGDLFDVRDLQLDAWNDIQGLEVRPVLSPHPVETTIMYFRALWEHGYRSYGHLADIASDDVMRKLVAPDGAPHGLSRALYERTLAAYHEKADIKKIDIGGGLIHGEARDFRGDPAGKLILAHTNRRLSEAERAIGSGAPFSTVDVLIRGTSDVFRRRAYEYLHAYFSDVPRHRIRHLLNCDVEVFNPEVLLLREGDAVENVRLVLSGSVEVLRGGSVRASTLSAGSIIGESAGLLDVPIAESYRAIGFVRALRIPRNLYVEFVTRSALYRHIVQSHDKREFLRTQALFADGVSCITLNKVVTAAEPRALETGTVLEAPADELLVLRTGKGVLRTAAGYEERLGDGSYFGAKRLLAGHAFRATVHVESEIAAYALPLEIVTAIPAVRWKLLETHRRRHLDN